MKKKPAAPYDVVKKDFRLTDPSALLPSLQALRRMVEEETGRSDSSLVDGGFPVSEASYAFFGTYEGESQNKTSQSCGG